VTTAARAAELAGRLAKVVGAEQVRIDRGARYAYATDATPMFSGMPSCVVLPGSTSEVAAVLRVAAELEVPVIPRGARTNLSAGTVAGHGELMLVLTRMDRLLQLDAENLVAVCQPGLPTAKLGDAAEELGLLYPPDPGSRTTSTVGGNVAENEGGLRGLKHSIEEMGSLENFLAELYRREAKGAAAPSPARSPLRKDVR
jgi:glycolate oxidase